MQRKARAREEPSPGPPASETDAGPPMLREPTTGSGKPRHGHEKHCPAARIEATKKTSARGRNQAGTSEAPFMGLRGYCRLLQLQEAVVLPGGPRPAANTWVFEPASLS